MRFLETVKHSLIWRFLLNLQKVLLVLSSLFVVLIMCLEVVLRYVFKSDLFGIEEIVVIAAFWLYFMGSSYGVYEKSHVKADIIPQLLKPGARAFLSVIVNFTVASLCILFTVWAVEMVRYSIVWMPRSTGLRIPTFISQTSVLIGYGLMSLYSIVYFLEDLFFFISMRREGQA